MGLRLDSRKSWDFERKVDMEQQAAALMLRKKSPGLGFFLALLFGPLGLFYSSLVGGLVMVAAGIAAFYYCVTSNKPLALPLLVAIWGLIWLASIIWSVVGVSGFNRRLARRALRSSALVLLAFGLAGFLCCCEDGGSSSKSGGSGGGASQADVLLMNALPVPHVYVDNVRLMYLETSSSQFRLYQELPDIRLNPQQACWLPSGLVSALPEGHYHFRVDIHRASGQVDPNFSGAPFRWPSPAPGAGAVIGRTNPYSIPDVMALGAQIVGH